MSNFLSAAQVMIRKTVQFFFIFFCVFGVEAAYSIEICPFSFSRQDGTFLEGYFSPPDVDSFPILVAIQGSACESS